MKKHVQMIQETSNNEIIVTNDIPKVQQTEFLETCLHCSRLFKSKRGFKDHVCKMGSHDVSSFACDFKDCSFIALDGVSLFEHRSVVHAMSPNDILKGGRREPRTMDVCKTCNKSFKSRKGFQQHKCKSIRLVQCPLESCGQQVHSMGEYFQHVQDMHHGISSGTPIIVVPPDSQIKGEDFDVADCEVVESEIIIS